VAVQEVYAAVLNCDCAGTAAAGMSAVLYLRGHSLGQIQLRLKIRSKVQQTAGCCLQELLISSRIGCCTGCRQNHAEVTVPCLPCIAACRIDPPKLSTKSLCKARKCMLSYVSHRD
jgi:hypothetical protein